VVAVDGADEAALYYGRQPILTHQPPDPLVVATTR
jgi:hypothetical protein